LRGLGAFFIKRKIDPEPNKRDYVYRSVLQVYMEECLKLKHNFEFFIEGGRTRTGKPIIPKSGILSVVIEAFQSGLIKDALIVPVSFNYEKLVEGNYVNEQLGNPKKKESFVNAVKNLWKIIHSQYGYVNIDFSTPYSLKELIKSINVINHVGTGTTKEKMLINQLSSTSLYGVDMSTDQNRLLIDSIARHVIYDCSKTTVRFSISNKAFLFLISCIFFLNR
jgi:glycerol-3-phosphate O-acyltransferase 1/2